MSWRRSAIKEVNDWAHNFISTSYTIILSKLYHLFFSEQDDIGQDVKAVKFTKEKCKTELYIENIIKLWDCIMKSKIMTLVQAVLKSDNSKSLAAALFYGTCSVSMNFLNKAVVSSYNFNYPFFIMVCQMVTTIIFLDTLRYI